MNPKDRKECIFSVIRQMKQNTITIEEIREYWFKEDKMNDKKTIEDWNLYSIDQKKALLLKSGQLRGILPDEI